MTNRLSKEGAAESLARHQGKCTVCRHLHREAIEEEFVHWFDVWDLADKYKIADYRSIYRHARATGLIEARRENLHSALDEIVEHCSSAKPTADTILRAIRAYSCLDEHGRWTDPPARVVITATTAGHQPSQIRNQTIPASVSEPPAELEPQGEAQAALPPAPAPTVDEVPSVPNSDAGELDQIPVQGFTYALSD